MHDGLEHIVSEDDKGHILFLPHMDLLSPIFYEVKIKKSCEY